MAQYQREAFEDEYFLFNPASGETHLLNASAMWLLDSLAAEPASPAMLKARLLELTGADPGPEFDQALEFQFKHLRTLGLIERFDQAPR